MPIAHVCATCRQPLTYALEWDDNKHESSRWLHGEPADHDADPVPRADMNESQLNPVCDFCNTSSDLATSWVYPAAAFSISGSDGTTSRANVDDGEGWGACAKCHTLIEADNREALAARAASIAERRDPSRSFEDYLMFTRQAHGFFFASRTGPAFPAREFTGPQH